MFCLFWREMASFGKSSQVCPFLQKLLCPRLKSSRCHARGVKRVRESRAPHSGNRVGSRAWVVTTRDDASSTDGPQQGRQISQVEGDVCPAHVPFQNMAPWALSGGRGHEKNSLVRRGCIPVPPDGSWLTLTFPTSSVALPCPLLHLANILSILKKK